MFEDHSANQIAAELNQVQHYDPQYTGALSMLDEATLRWTLRHPVLSAPQNAFSQARYRQKPTLANQGRDQQQAWADVVTAAEALALALRPYGDEQLQFCGVRSVYGTCHGLVHDGPCTRSDNHVND
ncbi:hypothetical protein [Kitasatospora sp. NBC_01302]|uniref:hypothetical protein n=1 Tax=Kitasatospora sp. NBC_01302 TaxID=2903575 RepID=UPI002E0DAD5D|nr:hypothetical protein OG294_14040 [Kitasatospora sp. NBC_01302]